MGIKMKEYEIMRTKWLEIATRKLDYEAKNAEEISQVNNVQKAKKIDKKQQDGQGVAKSITNLKVQLSLLEYEDRFIPLPTFASSIALITGFTFIFPVLAIEPLPIFSIFSVLYIHWRCEFS